MAEAVNTLPRIFALLVAVAALLAQPAWAGLADPTRPPAGLGQDATSETTPPALVVSTVFLMGKRPYAIVDGMTVRVGDRLGDARVTRIDEQGVWLAESGGKRLLKLLPEIDKRPLAGKKTMEKTR
jgi:MSHA biogenesis protein MshK